MAFTLTVEHVRSFLDPTSKGDWIPFFTAIDPEVKWTIASPKNDPSCCSGIFNIKSWQQNVAPIGAKLQGVLRMIIDSIDVIGNKAIIEAFSSAVQKNGNPYENRYCWIMIFDEETGKVVVIREYMNTALVKEVIETNP